MKKITVNYTGWGEQWPLGTLAESGNEVQFEYSPEALQRGVELSPRILKLSPQTYGNFSVFQHRLPGLVADCLPDGWGLLLMDRFFKKHRGLEAHQITALDRLAFLGERTMGALTGCAAAACRCTPWRARRLICPIGPKTPPNVQIKPSNILLALTDHPGNHHASET